MTYANNKGTDQQSDQHLFVRCLESRISALAKPRIAMMKHVSEAKEAGLNLSWSEIPKTHFRMAWLICFCFLNSNWSQCQAYIYTLKGNVDNDLKILAKPILYNM